MTIPPPMPPEALLRHADFLRSLARRLVGDESLADDLVQDTWMTYAQRPPSPGSGLRGWLAGVVRNLVHRERRSGRRRRDRELAVARSEAVSPGADALERGDLVRDVTDAVLALEEPYRTAILLRHYEGLTPAAIAKRVGAPLDTVKSRLQRGHARLRERLESRYGEDRDWVRGLLALAAPGRGAPLATGSGTASSASIPAAGVLIMSTNAKIAAGLAAALVGLAAFGLWRGVSGNAARPSPQASRPAPAVELRAPEEPAEVESSEAASERVAAPGPAEAPEPAPETPAEPEPFGSLRIEVVYVEPPGPAAGRELEIFAFSAPEPWIHRVVLTTDAEGLAHVERLPAGRVNVYDDLAGGGGIQILAGEVAEMRLEIPDGIDVEVEVVDGSGRPVADAAVWLSDYGNPGKGGVRGRTDERGRLELRDVGRGRHLAAFADGYGASEQVRFGGAPGERVEVLLHLRDRGARVAGWVLDPEGLPVAGAGVRLAPPEELNAPSAPPFETRTDEQGHFEFVGALLGTHELAVRKPGFAPISERLDLQTDLERTLRLVAAGIVAGVALDEAGRPVAAAEVRHGLYGEFLSSYTRTDSEGAFRLENLPVGEVSLVASSDEHGSAEVTLAFAPGVELPWNPVLSEGLVIAGRVVDEQGAPRPGFEVAIVSSVPEPGSLTLWGRYETADAQGRFRVAGCPPHPMSVRVSPPGNSTTLVAILPEVRAGGEQLTITVADADLPNASVHGRLLDADGEPAGATLTARGAGENLGFHRVETDHESGRFEFAGLRPGTYAMHAEPRGRPTQRVVEFTLAVEEQKDLGDLYLVQAGRLWLTVDGRSDVLAPYEHVRLLPVSSADNPGSPVLLEAPRPEGIDLAPGSYRVEAVGSEVAVGAARFELEPGGELTLDLRSTPGVSCTVQWELPADVEPPRMLSLVVRDAEGRVRYTTSVLEPEREGLRAELRLEPGSYELVSRSTDGLKGSARLEVPTGSSGVRVVLPLQSAD